MLVKVRKAVVGAFYSVKLAYGWFKVYRVMDYSMLDALKRSLSTR